MITKSKLLSSIKDLPDKFSVDELIDRLVLMQKIEIGLEQSKKGQINSTKEAKQKLSKWFK